VKDPRRVVVTREAADAAVVVEALGREGLDAWVVPAIAIASPADTGPLDAALASLSSFNWLLFSSAHAVEVVCAHPQWAGVRHLVGNGVRTGAAGPMTAISLRRHGVAVSVTATAGGASVLASAVAGGSESLAGMRVLWPRADIASKELAERLAARGAEVTAPVAYRTVAVPPADLDALVEAIRVGKVHAITFFSPSSATAVARALDGTLRRLAGRVVLAAIGPTTAKALAALGAPPEVVAPSPTARALAQALARHLSSIGDPV
jgi:uroporphyrinogen-III synthase